MKQKKLDPKRFVFYESIYIRSKTGRMNHKDRNLNSDCLWERDIRGTLGTLGKKHVSENKKLEDQHYYTPPLPSLLPNDITVIYEYFTGILKGRGKSIRARTLVCKTF